MAHAIRGQIEGPVGRPPQLVSGSDPCMLLLCLSCDRWLVFPEEAREFLAGELQGTLHAADRVAPVAETGRLVEASAGGEAYRPSLLPRPA